MEMALLFYSCLLLPLTCWATSVHNVRIASETLTILPYGGLNLAVWEHTSNENEPVPSKKNYYVMPLVALLSGRAKCSFAALSRRHLLRLQVLMWSDDLQNAAVLHLRYIGVIQCQPA